MTVNEIVKVINEKGSKYQKKILFDIDKTFIFDYLKIDNYNNYLEIIFKDYKDNLDVYIPIFDKNINLKQSLFGLKLYKYFDFDYDFEPKNSLKETLDYYMLDYNIEEGYLECNLKYNQFNYLQDNGFVLKILKGNLNLYSNNLIEINLNELKEINGLYCSYNNLIELNLNKLEKVNELYCSNNQLTKLNLENLKEINDLNCSYNQLIKLNLNKINKIYELNCLYNPLKYLNLSNLKEINYFNFYNTSLSYLTKKDLLSGFNNFNEKETNEYKPFKYIKSFKLFEQTIYKRKC